MFKILVALLLLSAISLHSGAQLMPAEGSRLHYRIIGFSFPTTGPKTSRYVLEIANGNINSPDSFKRNIVKTVTDKNNKIIAEVPAFGSSYTWRVGTSENNNTTLAYGSLHHFSTLAMPNGDTNLVRIRIVKPAAAKYKDAYVFLDGNGALYDMEGHPVWFLPSLNGINDGSNLPNDMKMTAAGTITFLLRTQAYEINYNGDLLWKGPNNGKVNGDSLERYHHEFTRLSNGHYMALGSESFPMGESRRIAPGGELLPPITLPMGTIIEYDKQGNVVWSWKASSYYPKSDFQYYSRPNKDHVNIITDPHENGFFFDEKNKNIYISCKNISRVLKVKYPEGTVVSAYGEAFEKGKPSKDDNGLFCHQHSPRYSQKGYLYLFNNNTCGLQPGIPKIIKMQEPAFAGGQPKKVWEYDFSKEGGYESMMSGGGNVIELPDESMFVCLGNQYGSTVIVSPDKKILWSAMPEKYMADQNKWIPIPEYRASIILNPKELESLIWGK